MRDWKQYVREHLSPLGLSGAREQEIVEEIAQQLEDAQSEAISRGLAQSQAEVHASAQISDWNSLARDIRRAEQPVANEIASRLPANFRDAVHEENIRKHRGGNMFADLIQDLRYTLRMLRKSPGFTALVVLTLALGIGGNTAIFSLVNDALLKPLPYRDPERLVMAWETNAGQLNTQNIVAAPNYLDWEQQNHIFDRMAIWEFLSLNLSGQGNPEMVGGLRASSQLFDVLGVQPIMGRTFTKDEEAPGKNHVVVLSYGLWRRSYASDPAIIGKNIRINQESYAVIGVMPQGFAFPVPQEKLWVPIGFNEGDRSRESHSFYVSARLKAGITFEKARAEMDALGLRLAQAYPETNHGDSATITSMRDLYLDQFRQVMIMLLLAVGFVLLIACVNVANLLLARGNFRRKEFALRAALGASGSRIFRQLMTESILLAIVGGAAGAALTLGITPLFLKIMPESLRNIPFRDLTVIHPDARVFAFTLGVALLTGIIFGLVPALHAFSVAPGESIKEGARGNSGSAGRRLRDALVIAEVALALTVLASAGLMITSMKRLLAVSPGFDTKNVIAMDMALPQKEFYGPPTRPMFCQQMEEHVAQLPGVVSVSAVGQLPMMGRATRTLTLEGQPEPPPGGSVGVTYSIACPDYFRTMGIPLLEGREFSGQDSVHAPGTVIISARLKDRFFPNEDPIGRRIKLVPYKDEGPWKTIVGIVGNVRQRGLDQAVLSQVYLPYSQAAWPQMTIVVRAESNPALLTPGIRKALGEVVPEQAVGETVMLENVVENSVGPRKFPMLLLSGFAIVALALTAIGVYGVVSYGVAQRTHEIGIRIALGARAGRIYRLIAQQAMVPVVVGVAVGVGAALALSKYLQNQLYSVRATNPFVLGGAVLLLIVVAILACFVPARRACRVDPLVALRHD